ncbi:SRPBCC family protein [Paenibacillus arenilitoris]|uniref:SRPBCC domain-containing protein n=1 Tax=Paenibacillus arenilitoris TaxID=2772299 RepID=A0A927CUE6_9BACL|nr:SRPBCC family protein [Paenibacillus arenilitoris]MBD2872406.1 SRPBCC domain-containing protein [Paenibacillus arenilitoris]
MVMKEIYIECRPETLFPYFTDPQKMVRWMGSQVLLEPKLGGSLRIDFNGRDMVAGHYVEVEPNERILFTWGWIGSDTIPPGSSTVEVLLYKQDNGTLLVLKHSGLPDPRSHKHLAGWNYYTARLKLVLLGIEPGPDTFAAPTTNEGD